MLSELQFNPILTALILALFAGMSEYVILWQSHRKREYGIALANAFGGITQVMFLVFPYLLHTFFTPGRGSYPWYSRYGDYDRDHPAVDRLAGHPRWQCAVIYARRPRLPIFLKSQTAKRDLKLQGFGRSRIYETYLTCSTQGMLCNQVEA